LKQAGKVSALAGTLGVIFPVLMGWGAAALFGIGLEAGLFVGLILAATSVSISAQTLMELKVLRSREGVALLGAAVFDDVLVILLLSVFVALVIGTGSAGLAGVAWVIVRMGLYLGLATLLGIRFIPRLAERVTNLPISQGLMAAVLITGLFYAWAAKVWGGMAAITGAFLAGLLFGRTHFSERIEAGMHTLAYALFVPVFFVNIGLEVNARDLLTAGSGLFVIVICLVGILSKIIGSGLGAAGWLL
ncbi:MAG: cation:proton antiporter, partial [Chloroflexota bacterium]